MTRRLENKKNGGIRTRVTIRDYAFCLMSTSFLHHLLCICNLLPSCSVQTKLPKHMARLCPMRPRRTRGTGISLGSRVWPLPKFVLNGSVDRSKLGDVCPTHMLSLQSLLSTSNPTTVFGGDSRLIIAHCITSVHHDHVRDPTELRLYNDDEFNTEKPGAKNASRTGK